MDGLIYAYTTSKSAGQRAYTEARLAQLAQQRREQRERSLQKSPSQESSVHIERTTSRGSASQGSSSPPATLRTLRYSRKCSWAEIPRFTNTIMDDNNVMTRTATAGSLPPPQTAIQRTMSERQEQDLLSNPFELRHGRRYLREVPYPLPCDLAETQRQNLRTLLCISVFGGPLSTTKFDENPPKKVLEVGCGTGYWSAMCHDHFAERGHTDVEFVGFDIAPIAPNLNKKGMKWKFVQHDLRRAPWPFEDAEFDLVMMKDLSLIMTVGTSSENTMMDCVRLLRDGGVLEVWDSDYPVRSLMPDAPPPPSKKPKEQAVAEETGTFAVSPGHPFVPAQNKFIAKASKWIMEALDRRKLYQMPCARIAEVLLMEPELTEFAQWRVAVPLGELRWERKASQLKRSNSNGHDSPMSVGSREKGVRGALTPDQAGLRQTALITFLQMIESMEPILREASGKNSEEWSQWWANMMSDLLDPNPTKGGLTGECLELGAWWATKITLEE